jgi:hypothetical protein
MPSLVANAAYTIRGGVGSRASSALATPWCERWRKAATQTAPTIAALLEAFTVPRLRLGSIRADGNGDRANGEALPRGPLRVA